MARPPCTPAAIRAVLAANADADVLRRYDNDLDTAFEQARERNDVTPLVETVRRWRFEADACKATADPTRLLRTLYFGRITKGLCPGFGSRQARPERAAIAFGSSSDPTSARNLLSSSSWSVAAPSTRPKCGS